jgi:hypothetical protein
MLMNDTELVKKIEWKLISYRTRIKDLEREVAELRAINTELKKLEKNNS